MVDIQVKNLTKFFVIGDNALKSPAMLSQIAAQGHAIGLHTMHHNAAALTDAEAILADIEEENLLLSRRSCQCNA